MAPIFRTRDTELRTRNGSQVEIVGITPARRFNPAEIDDDTAPMVEVRFADGYTTDVYEDELTI